MNMPNTLIKVRVFYVKHKHDLIKKKKKTQNGVRFDAIRFYVKHSAAMSIAIPHNYKKNVMQSGMFFLINVLLFYVLVKIFKFYDTE